MKASLRILVSLGVLAGSSAFAQKAVNFVTGGPAGAETSQNQFIFADNGVTATVTAWSVSRTNTSAGFQQSQVTQWGPGIGVRNSSEVITDTPYVPFYVDNEDHYDFALIVFSEKVLISQIRITPSAGTFDLDASYWFGNVSPGLQLAGDTFTSLASHGFGTRINDDSVASNTARTLSLNTPAGGVNAILFGARVGGDAEFDRFKIASITGMTAVPEPATAALLVASLGLLARRRR